MEAIEQARFERLHQQHLLSLKVQSKRPKAIDVYSRAMRQLRDHPDTGPQSPLTGRAGKAICYR